MDLLWWWIPHGLGQLTIVFQNIFKMLMRYEIAMLGIDDFSPPTFSTTQGKLERWSSLLQYLLL